jgi:hypothetical protein
MAYAFAGTSNQHLTCAAPVTGNPMTMAAWFRPDNVTGVKTILSLGTGDNTQRYWLYNNATLVAYDARDAAGVSSASVSGVASAGTWSHACAVEFAGAGRRVYGNGVVSGASNAARTPASIDEFYIGIDRATDTFSNPMTGQIAEVGVWSAALTADEVRSLSQGVACRLVRPQSLLFYAPLIRTLQDLARNATLTNGNSATVEVHPRIYA